jgi:hypothetical protein
VEVAKASILELQLLEQMVVLVVELGGVETIQKAQRVQVHKVVVEEGMAAALKAVAVEVQVRQEVLGLVQGQVEQGQLIQFLGLQ